MDVAIDQELGFLKIDVKLNQKIQSIRNEISKAINTAKLRNDFDCDVCLSFGSIHINPYGSVSAISCGGVDVSNIDQFVVEQALQSKAVVYQDIRQAIRDNPEKFLFYPILVDEKICLTILKYSPFILEKFGSFIVFSHELFHVSYTPKYMIVSVKVDRDWKTYCFLCGPFSPEETFKRDMRAGRQYLGENIFLAYSKARPEIYCGCGRNKQELSIPEAAVFAFNFYKSTILKAAMQELKMVDENGKPSVKKSKAAFFKFVIELQYSTIKEFCERHSVNQESLFSYLRDMNSEVKFKNGNVLTPSRLEDLLNLPFQISEQSFLKRNLLEPIEYKDIPDAEAY